MADQLSRAVGYVITFIEIPPDSILWALFLLGFPTWQVDSLPEVFAMYRRGEAVAVESGVNDALGRPLRFFAKFARGPALLFS